MKRNILKVVHVAAVVVVAGYGVHKNQSKETLSDAMLENVEVLATGEITIGCCLALWGDCQDDVKAPYVTCTIN